MSRATSAKSGRLSARSKTAASQIQTEIPAEPTLSIEEKMALKLKNLKNAQYETENQNREKLQENTSATQEFTTNLLNTYETNWEKHKKESVEYSSWTNYMKCDPTPNFNITNDMAEFTTWLTLKRDNLIHRVNNHVATFKTSGKNGTVAANAALKKVKINEINVFMQEIQEMIQVLESFEMAEKENYMQELQEIYVEMKQLIAHILDQSTLQFLRKASNYTDDDTGNVQIEESDQFHDIYIWGNLANNPRMKSVDFGDPESNASHVSINLIKGMHEQKLAIRAVRKKYDGMICEVEPRNLGAGRNSEDNGLDLTPVPSIIEDKNDDGDEVGSTVSVLKSGRTSKVGSQAAIPEEPAAEAEAGKSGEEAVQPLTIPEQPEGEAGEEEESTLESIAEEIQYPSDMYSMNDYNITGGTWDFDIFQIPNQPKKAGKWTIKQMYDPEG